MRSEDEKGQCTSDASHERCEHCGEGHLAGCPKHQGTKESEKFSPYDPNAIVNRLTPEDEKLLQRTKEACTGCGSTGEKHYYPCPTIEHRPNDAFPDGHAKACPVRLGVGSYCDCPGMSMTPPPCQSSRFPRPCDCCKARILARADAEAACARDDQREYERKSPVNPDTPSRLRARKIIASARAAGDVLDFGMGLERRIMEAIDEARHGLDLASSKDSVRLGTMLKAAGLWPAIERGEDLDALIAQHVSARTETPENGPDIEAVLRFAREWYQVRQGSDDGPLQDAEESLEYAIKEWLAPPTGGTER